MKLITGSFYKNKYTFYEKKFDICNVKTVLNGINAEHIILFNTNQYINNTRCWKGYFKPSFIFILLKKSWKMCII